jgi:LysR family transcriptional regulator, regulator for bpeEF and oprC
MQDLRTLAIFVKVAERRSFVRAATDLGITQSGVSNAISRLEQQLGTRLLARTTRRVSLTEHGAAYFERCCQALAELEEAELKDSQLEPSGNLRIGIVRPPQNGAITWSISGAISAYQASRHVH